LFLQEQIKDIIIIYLKHLLLHSLAQVIECASGEAEETLS
jgi:hypothetical protein